VSATDLEHERDHLQSPSFVLLGLKCSCRYRMSLSKYLSVISTIFRFTTASHLLFQFREDI
jgi:hypothetical protein